MIKKFGVRSIHVDLNELNSHCTNRNNMQRAKKGENTKSNRICAAGAKFSAPNTIVETR